MKLFTAISTLTFLVAAHCPLPSSALDVNQGINGIRGGASATVSATASATEVTQVLTQPNEGRVENHLPPRDLQRFGRDREYQSITCNPEITCPIPRGAGGDGIFVCRTIGRPGSDSEASISLCINPERSIEGDMCGCCSTQCPDVCQCRCMLEDDEDEDNNDNDDDNDNEEEERRGGRGGQGRGRGRGGRHGGRRGIELEIDGELQCVHPVEAEAMLIDPDLSNVLCSESCLSL